MENSPFAKLAPETRNAIWELALTHSTSVTLTEPRMKPITTGSKQIDSVTVGNPSNASNASDANPTQSRYGTDISTVSLSALTATCKQIHNECGRLFYFVNSFELQTRYFVDGDQFESTPRVVQMLSRLPAAIGPANTAVLSDVTVNLGTTSGGKWHYEKMITLINTLSRQPTAPHWSTKATFSIRLPDNFIWGGYRTIACTFRLDDPKSGIDRMLVEMTEIYWRQRRHATYTFTTGSGSLCTRQSLLTLQLIATWLQEGNGFPYMKMDSATGEWDVVRRE